MAVPGLKEYEKRFAADSHLFARDSERHAGIVRYTVAFRVLFAMQLAFGIGTVIYGIEMGMSTVNSTHTIEPTPVRLR